jgi:pimeloyl-ACP methyl ester carboxylesterase
VTLRHGTARVSSSLVLPYVEHGDRDGTPVVFLHAYVDSWRSFAAVLPHLPASIRAVAPTQRVHGDAGKPASGYAVDDFAGDVTAFLDVVGLERAVLVASSSAVFTVERFAERAPERVLGLVFLGVPWSLSEVPAVRRFLAEVSKLTDPVDEEYVRRFVSGTAGEAVSADFVDEQIRESLKVPANVWRATLEGLVEASPPGQGAIAAPALVIWGDQDAFVSRDDQERLLDAIPGSRLLVYEGVGHLVQWEEPERVAADIAAFVATLEP